MNRTPIIYLYIFVYDHIQDTLGMVYIIIITISFLLVS